MRPSRLLRLMCLLGATVGNASGLTAADSSAATPLAPLEEVMPRADFEAAGLEKLSAVEREALRQWLERYLAGEREEAAEVTAATVAGVEARAAAALAEAEAAATAASARAAAAEAKAAAADQLPQGEDAFGLEDVRERVAAIFQREGERPEAIESRILGEFRGWSGKTVFRLENGQVWQQSERGEFYLPKKDAVAVIERGMLGAYYLKIQGYGSRVRVRRVE
jgi:hypothetical protein